MHEEALKNLQADSTATAVSNGHELRPWFMLMGGVCVAKTKCKHCGRVVSCHVNDDGKHAVGAALDQRCRRAA